MIKFSSASESFDLIRLHFKLLHKRPPTEGEEKSLFLNYIRYILGLSPMPTSNSDIRRRERKGRDNENARKKTAQRRKAA